MRNTKSASAANVTHGMTKTRVFRIWSGMIARCSITSSGSYKNYGARGICVCDRWRIFENFLADMGMPPTGYQIDRINNDGDYSPDNCRWVSAKENSRNRRTTHFIEFNGQVKTISEWASMLGLTHQALHRRLKILKWPLDKALNTRSRYDHRTI